MHGLIPTARLKYAVPRVAIVMSAAILVMTGIGQSDDQPRVTKEGEKANPKAPREPKWLPVRDLRVDSFSIEYNFSAESKDGDKKPIEGTRKATVVCLRAIFPQQEQLDEIAAAIPALTTVEPEGAPRPASDLLAVQDFKIERQDADAHVKAPDWTKSPWVEVSTESLIDRLFEAEDFDPEIVDLAEANPTFTSPLPKLAKGRWDGRVSHPSLSENKLSVKKGDKADNRKTSRVQAPQGVARFALFRFFDFDSKPDRAYRYRVKLVSENPGFGEETLPREIANGEFRESPWSDPSPPVVVAAEAK